MGAFAVLAQIEETASEGEGICRSIGSLEVVVVESLLLRLCFLLKDVISSIGKNDLLVVTNVHIITVAFHVHIIYLIDWN